MKNQSSVCICAVCSGFLFPSYRIILFNILANIKYSSQTTKKDVQEDIGLCPLSIEFDIMVLSAYCSLYHGDGEKD